MKGTNRQKMYLVHGKKLLKRKAFILRLRSEWTDFISHSADACIRSFLPRFNRGSAQYRLGSGWTVIFLALFDYGCVYLHPEFDLKDWDFLKRSFFPRLNQGTGLRTNELSIFLHQRMHIRSYLGPERFDRLTTQERRFTPSVILSPLFVNDRSSCYFNCFPVISTAGRNFNEIMFSGQCLVVRYYLKVII